MKYNIGPSRICKAVTAVLMALALTVVTALYEDGFYTLRADAASVSDLKDEFKEMEESLKDLKDDLKDMQDAEAGYIQQMSNYNQQIDLVEEQIASVDKQIELLGQSIEDMDGQIAELEKQIEALNISIEENYEKFKERLKAFHLAGEANTLEILLGSESFADFLNRYAIVTAVAERDKALMDSLSDEIKSQEKVLKDTEELKKTVESERDEAKQLQKDLDAKQKELDDTIGELEDLLEEIRSDEEKTQAAIKELDADMEALEKEIEEAIRNSTGSYVGGTFLWPCPEYTRISSNYGYRTHPVTGEKQKFHKGTDMASPKNSPILAANDGKVTAAYDYERSGYGKYLIIDHGGGYVTLYAHCNKVLVKKGDKVKQGDLIAKVGKTGTATGYHLHFEIRIKDQTVDPMDYFPNMK